MNTNSNYGSEGTVLLDELVKGELPDRILEEIKKCELTLGELYKYLKSLPVVYLSIKDYQVSFGFNIRFSLKKPANIVVTILLPAIAYMIKNWDVVLDFLK